ncbi:MAG: hypothetical protein IMZ50_08515 [Candidatus Atribacteria bacterium]|nr:hypothetical protein [Candidatus Atribacteria bacterium]
MVDEGQVFRVGDAECEVRSDGRLDLGQRHAGRLICGCWHCNSDSTAGTGGGTVGDTPHSRPA